MSSDKSRTTPRTDELRRETLKDGMALSFRKAIDLARELERDLASLQDEVAAHLTKGTARSSIATSTEPGRIPDLEGARINADYWLNAARNGKDRSRAEAILAAEQAINSWKNAAYAMADQRDSARSAIGEREARYEMALQEIASMHTVTHDTTNRMTLIAAASIARNALNNPTDDGAKS